LAWLSGIAADFTCFVAYAGGSPFQAYILPQGLEKRIYAGSAVMYFLVVYAVKRIPYAMSGSLIKLI